jgi:hypothetical protein
MKRDGCETDEKLEGLVGVERNGLRNCLEMSELVMLRDVMLLKYCYID